MELSSGLESWIINKEPLTLKGHASARHPYGYIENNITWNNHPVSQFGIESNEVPFLNALDATKHGKNPTSLN